MICMNFEEETAVQEVAKRMEREEKWGILISGRL